MYLRQEDEIQQFHSIGPNDFLGQMLFKIVHTTMMNSFYSDKSHRFFLSFFLSCCRTYEFLVRFYLLLSLALFSLALVFLSLSVNRLFFLFHLPIDWINMKEIEWNSISNKNYLFVFEGDFYFDIENAFSSSPFYLYLVVISFSLSLWVLDMQFNWIGLYLEYGCSRACVCIRSIIMENWTKICFYLPKHSHLLDNR